MRILIACEYSGRVRNAFRRKGHEAYSCDIRRAIGSQNHHILGDVREILHHSWDLMVAFPPCTYLTTSNAHRWAGIEAQRAQALEFITRLWDAPIPKIAIENPRGAIGTHLGLRSTQEIQPWQFGDPYYKRTALWLKNLPPLVPMNHREPPGVRHWVQAGYKTPGLHRDKDMRSLTFPGVAEAMAQQWG